VTAAVLGVLLLAAAGAPAGAVAALAAGRFEGPTAPPRRWLILGLPLAMALTAALVPQPERIAGAVLAAVLLIICAIDAATFRIPDALSLPLLGAGLLLGRLAPATLADRLAGAVAGFLVMAALSVGYRVLRGREGLGLGDAKLLAAGGAWLGWQSLPSTLLLAAGGGLLMVAWGVLRRGRRAVAEAIAFGPPLAAAIWLGWLLAAHRDGV
jgi:leader peptidase (prepilin peptidase)/N-methyltransferase